MEDKSRLIDELRTTLGKLEVALGAIHTAIVLADGKSIIQWCNSPFDRLVDLPHIQVLGGSLVKLLPLSLDGKPLSLETHPAKASLPDKPQLLGCYEFRRGDQIFTLEISGAQVHLDDGEGNGVLVILDVTERKRAERAINSLNTQLKQKVDELELLNKVMMGREERIVELKEEIEKLKTQLSE